MYEYTLMLDRATRRPYMVEEKKVDYPNVTRMSDPDQIVRMMISVYRMADKAEEYLYMLTMNTKMDITGVFLIGKGDVNTCIASVRDVMTMALLSGASGIVLVHNHPSGDPTPSDLDLTICKRVATVGALLQVQLIDSIVIGDNVYHSMHGNEPDALEPMEVPNEWIR